MPFNFSNVKSITIPEGIVKKIEDSNGNVIWKSGWRYTINIGDYVSTARYKIGTGSWITISASTTVVVDSGLTLYIQALSYNADTAQYDYTLYNGDISRTEANDGGSVTVYQTRSTKQYAVTITGTRCSANKSSGTYAYGTVITWTADTNCAFNSTGTTTTQTATITGSGTYSKTASYVKCTTSGIHCSANKTGWMSYGTTITWTADSDYHFGIIAGEYLDYVTDTAIPGSLSKTAPYLKQYKVVINNRSSYTIYVQAENASDFTIASGSSSTLTYDYDYSSYVKFKKEGDSTWSSTVTYSSYSDTRSNHSLNAYVSTSSGWSWSTYNDIDYYMVTYKQGDYPNGAELWCNDYRGGDVFNRNGATHIKLVYNGNTYIAPIPSGLPTEFWDCWGMYDQHNWYSDCITGLSGLTSGRIFWWAYDGSDDEDSYLDAGVGIVDAGSWNNYNHFTTSECEYGSYSTYTTYSPYWG